MLSYEEQEQILKEVKERPEVFNRSMSAITLGIVSGIFFIASGMLFLFCGFSDMAMDIVACILLMVSCGVDIGLSITLSRRRSYISSILAQEEAKFEEQKRADAQAETAKRLEEQKQAFKNQTVEDIIAIAMQNEQKKEENIEKTRNIADRVVALNRRNLLVCAIASLGMMLGAFLMMFLPLYSNVGENVSFLNIVIRYFKENSLFLGSATSVFNSSFMLIFVIYFVFCMVALIISPFIFFPMFFVNYNERKIRDYIQNPDAFTSKVDPNKVDLSSGKYWVASMIGLVVLSAMILVFPVYWMIKTELGTMVVIISGLIIISSLALCIVFDCVSRTAKTTEEQKILSQILKRKLVRK